MQQVLAPNKQLERPAVAVDGGEQPPGRMELSGSEQPVGSEELSLGPGRAIGGHPRRFGVQLGADPRWQVGENGGQQQRVGDLDHGTTGVFHEHQMATDHSLVERG